MKRGYKSVLISLGFFWGGIFFLPDKVDAGELCQQEDAICQRSEQGDVALFSVGSDMPVIPEKKALFETSRDLLPADFRILRLTGAGFAGLLLVVILLFIQLSKVEKRDSGSSGRKERNRELGDMLQEIQEMRLELTAETACDIEAEPFLSGDMGLLESDESTLEKYENVSDISPELVFSFLEHGDSTELEGQQDRQTEHS